MLLKPLICHHGPLSICSYVGWHWQIWGEQARSSNHLSLNFDLVFSPFLWCTCFWKAPKINSNMVFSLFSILHISIDNQYFRLGTYNKYGYGAEHVLRLRVQKISRIFKVWFFLNLIYEGIQGFSKFKCRRSLKRKLDKEPIGLKVLEK